MDLSSLGERKEQIWNSFWNFRWGACLDYIWRENEIPRNM